MLRWHVVRQRFDQLLQQGWLRPVGREIMIAAAVMLAAAFLLLGVNYEHMQRGFALHERADTTLLMLDQTESKLVGVEMTVRGYALTHDVSFLTYQADERAALRDLLHQLDAALVDEPAQKAHFDRLRPMIDQRLKLYAYLSTPAHAAEAAHAITDPATRKVMRDVRTGLRDMCDKQLGLLRQRQEALKQQVRQTALMTGFILLFAFASVILGIVMMVGGTVKSSG